MVWPSHASSLYLSCNFFPSCHFEPFIFYTSFFMCLFWQQGNRVFPDLLAAAAPSLGQHPYYLPGPNANTNVNFKMSVCFLDVQILQSVKKVTGWSELCLQFRSSMNNNFQKELRHIRIVKFQSAHSLISGNLLWFSALCFLNPFSNPWLWVNFSFSWEPNTTFG